MRGFAAPCPTNSTAGVEPVHIVTYSDGIRNDVRPTVLAEAVRRMSSRADIGVPVRLLTPPHVD